MRQFYEQMRLTTIVLGLIFATTLFFYAYNRLYIDCEIETQQPKFFISKLALEAPEFLILWDMPISFETKLTFHQVEKKETIQQILQQNGLKFSSKLAQLLYDAETRAAKIMKQIQPQEHLHFIVERDTVTHFIVEASNEEYYIHPEHVSTLSERVARQTKTTYRKIDLTLKKGIYSDLAEVRVPGKIIQQLSEVLGQRIDLKKNIRVGDKISLFYSVSPQNKIELHRFSLEQEKNLITGYHYPHQGCNFVDKNGLSFKKSFLERPVEPSVITSGFSLARHHPVLGVVRAHKGVDFAAPKGSPVYATADAIVSYIGTKGGYGNLVELDHGKGIKTLYAHLDSFSPTLTKGKTVQQGQIIGFVGMTGLATGPHLHYEYRIHDVPVDPLTVNIPKKTIFKGNDMVLFQQKMKEIDDLETSVILD